ncbi:MAG: DUF1294 domain-containing protein [Planctomycetota bacterium]|jgi:uncharacterized membrane protein YsdA (DUF1294 family)
MKGNTHLIAVTAVAITILTVALQQAGGWRVVPAYLLAINIAAFVVYGLDKLRARKNLWRVPEVLLHLLAALGATPAAAIAQLVFRHKTAKLRFRVIFWSIALAQLAALSIWWFYYRSTP